MPIFRRNRTIRSDKWAGWDWRVVAIFNFVLTDGLVVCFADNMCGNVDNSIFIDFRKVFELETVTRTLLSVILTFSQITQCSPPSFCLKISWWVSPNVPAWFLRYSCCYAHWFFLGYRTRKKGREFPLKFGQRVMFLRGKFLSDSCWKKRFQEKKEGFHNCF